MITATKRSLLETLQLFKRLDNHARIAGDSMYNVMIKIMVGLTAIFIVAIILNLIGLKIINLPLSILVSLVMMLTFLDTDNLMTLLSIQISNKLLPEKLQMEPLDDIFVLFLILIRRLTLSVSVMIALLGVILIEESFTSFMILTIGGILLSLNGNHAKEYEIVGGTKSKEKGSSTIFAKIIVFIMVIALLNLLVTASRIYTNTGYDSKGWFEETAVQKKAFKALKQYKINKNLACADRWGGTKKFFNLMGNSKFLDKSFEEQQAAMKCMEKINMSPSNPKKDLPAIITTIKSLLAEDPEPQLCGQIVFEPRFANGGQRVTLPATCKTPYTVSVEGEYIQIFGNGPSYINARTGIAVNPMLPNEMAIMPIQNLSIYGICLIDKIPVTRELKRTKRFMNITINIPQNNYIFSGISEIFILNFYN